MAKYLGRDRKCFYVDESHNGLRKPCVVADEEVRAIDDDETYVVTVEGKTMIVRGVELAPM